MFDRIRLASCLVLAVASQARADVPPLVPHATTSITIESSDTAHAWVAYPLNFSHGAPLEAYAQITPGEPYDPARSWPDIYAFPAASVVEVTPDPTLSLPAGPGLLGAPFAFRQATTPFTDHSLTDFFTASHAPHARPLSPPLDEALVAARVTALLDVYAPTVEGDTLALRLLRTDYTFADGHTQSLPATADGIRTLPEAEAAAPPAEVSPAAGGCGCGVGVGAPPWTLAIAALLLIAVRRRA